MFVFQKKEVFLRDIKKGGFYEHTNKTSGN